MIFNCLLNSLEFNRSFLITNPLLFLHKYVMQIHLFFFKWSIVRQKEATFTIKIRQYDPYIVRKEQVPNPRKDPPALIVWN